MKWHDAITMAAKHPKKVIAKMNDEWGVGFPSNGNLYVYSFQHKTWIGKADLKTYWLMKDWSVVMIELLYEKEKK